MAAAQRLVTAAQWRVAVSGSRSSAVAASRSVDTVRWCQAVSDSARARAAAIALVWSTDLPRPLQQILVDTAYEVTPPVLSGVG